MGTSFFRISNKSNIHKSITLLLVGMSFFLSAHAQSDSVYIYGNAPDYAGKTLIIETTSNYIIRKQAELTRLKVASDGHFAGSFSTNQTLDCKIELGMYLGTFYAQPGENYQLILPPFKPRPEADRFNPFYQPEPIALGIATTEKNELNQHIASFETDFEAHYNAYAVTLFTQYNIPLAKQVCLQLDSIHPSIDNDYFMKLKHFRNARIYSLAMRRQKRQYIYQFFSNEPVQYHLPAYWESFNEVFKDFFSYYFQSPSGKGLRNAFNEGASYDTLSNILKADSLYTRDDFREAILNRALYDAYYSGRYDEKRIQDLISQAAQTSKTPESQIMAGQLYGNINKLKTGTEAPAFEAYDTNGKLKSLDNYKGKFVYLNFVHTQNYACKKQMQALTAIAKELKKELVVLTILTDENDSAAFAYTQKADYKWEFLHFGGNGKILSEYNIKAMPMYYLIDPDGNLSLSPAPAPEESFATRFLEVERNYKYKKAKTTPEKRRSIYDM